MESATLRRPPALPDTIRIGLIFGLILLAAVSWAFTDDQMGGMDAGPGTALGGLGWFIGVWVVMMAAMMFPSIAPMVLMYARIHEGRRERGKDAPAGAIAIFIAGYLVSWGAAGLLGYALVELIRDLDLAFLGWDEGGPYAAGAVIVGAALYQLTPLKEVCLRHCRSPLAFILHHWHDGRGGALRMGIEHGGYCVGCCWALMAALFALGVMSIGWMAFIAALIAIEKLAPWKEVANRGIALLLLVLGIAVAFTPEDVPGLTIPGSPDAIQAMEAMGMETEMEMGGAMEEGSAGSGGAMEEGMPSESMEEGMSGGGMGN